MTKLSTSFPGRERAKRRETLGTRLLICHQDGAFRKHSLNQRNLKTPNLRFSVERKHLKTKLFKIDEVTIIMASPCPSFTQNKSKMSEDCCVFKVLQCIVDVKHLMRFQSETSVFKFLRRSVGAALVLHYFIKYIE